MAFPAPLPIPKEVFIARKLRSSAMVRIAVRGIIVRFIIAIIELIGYAYFQSASLLLDSLSTFVDVASSILLIVSIKLAERPPDEDHPFGHGRYEPVVGMQLGIFLVLGGVGMFVHQFLGLFHLEQTKVMDSRAWLLPLVACVFLEISYRRMKKVADREQSPALLSEAFHFRVDSLNSLLALIALVLASIVPSWSWVFDSFGALAIALFMLSVGIYATKANLNQLLDRIPSASYFDKVRKAAMSVPQVRGTEKILIQQYGPDAHVDIDIEVDPMLSVEIAHGISQQVRNAVQKDWPQVRDVVVHIEPFYENDH
jgi:cation diffusion facilitator family transporter